MAHSKTLQLVLAGATAAVLPLAAVAQDGGGAVGFVGATLSFSDVVETRSPDSQLSYMPLAIEGNVAFPLFGRGMLGASGYFSMTDWDDSQANFDTDVPDSQTRLSLQYSHSVAQGLRVGAFGVYTRSSLFGGDLQRTPYETIYGGVSAQYFLGNDFMVFGQAGIGDTVTYPPDQSNTDPEGFDEGRFLRAGITWFPVDSTGLTFDFETAHAGVYQNGGSDADSGDFTSVGLSGETVLPFEFPLMATYFVRRDFFQSAAGPDLTATDLTVGVGFRILFGADTPRDSWQAGRLLDAPRLPARSVDWLEVLD